MLWQDVETLSYSFDGTKLAAGSHDNFIDIFDVTRGCVRQGVRQGEGGIERNGERQGGGEEWGEGV